MKHYNSWDEIDQDTGGLVTSLTYIVLFLNDQVYNSTIELKGNLLLQARGKETRQRSLQIYEVIQHQHRYYRKY